MKKIQKNTPKCVIFLDGVHGGIRTPDRTLRRRVLYPAELRRHLSRLLIYNSINKKTMQDFFTIFLHIFLSKERYDFDYKNGF